MRKDISHVVESTGLYLEEWPPSFGVYLTSRGGFIAVRKRYWRRYFWWRFTTTLVADHLLALAIERYKYGSNQCRRDMLALRRKQLARYVLPAPFTSWEQLGAVLAATGQVAPDGSLWEGGYSERLVPVPGLRRSAVWG